LGEKIAKVDPAVLTPELRSMSDLVAESVSQRCFQTILTGALAVTAILLAAIGIYGVVTFAVLERRWEIGIRNALGADYRNVKLLMFRQGNDSGL
jgi:ABC-type antimicrobial peptide transport system permease subunit